MDCDSILNALIKVSEKAANIARIIRNDSNLLSLLVQEKKDLDKNPRFVRDFKTFADVLVQEVVKYEMGSKFPELVGYIYGEENNEFQMGDNKVLIQVTKNIDQTEKLLNTVLGNDTAASVLTKEVHRNLEIDNSVVDSPIEFPATVGIWIDPIDSTAEYIAGGYKPISDGLFSGLPCVTVLIGLFNRETGSPLIGVINQPFYKIESEVWSGQYVYGVSIGGFKVFGPKAYPKCTQKVIAVSSSESRHLKKALSENGYKTIEVPGAGYKLFSIITGHICAYVLSKPTTFFWDTCACQAILESIGGGLVNMSTWESVVYTPGEGVKECSNKNGIVAYRDSSIRDDLKKVIESL